MAAPQIVPQLPVCGHHTQGLFPAIARRLTPSWACIGHRNIHLEDVVRTPWIGKTCHEHQEIPYGSLALEMQKSHSQNSMNVKFEK